MVTVTGVSLIVMLNVAVYGLGRNGSPNGTSASNTYLAPSGPFRKCAAVNFASAGTTSEPAQLVRPGPVKGFVLPHLHELRPAGGCRPATVVVTATLALLRTAAIRSRATDPPGGTRRSRAIASRPISAASINASPNGDSFCASR